MRNSNPNIDAFAEGYRVRLDLFGSVMNRLAPEFVRTKADAIRRRSELLQSDIRAKLFELIDEGATLRPIR